MATVDILGVPLHVQMLGQGGTPVVFLHGLVMDNLASWYFTVANPVAVTRAVVLYDYRGHGRSGTPATGYRLADFCDELLALLEHLGHAKVALVGHSFGGTLALAFADQHPDRVDRLVLLDPLVPDEGWGDRMAATLGADESDQIGVITSLFQDWLGRHSQRKRTRLEAQSRKLVHGTSLVADLRASHHVTAFADLPPVHLIGGTESDVRSQSAVLTVATQTLLPGTHSVMWEQTDAVRDAVLAALS